MWETRKFLVLVKTYPNPSASTQEAVCTAAVDEDGILTRLFPIPFRTMAEAQRFKKWQWIRAKVQKARSDTRPESYKVDYESIKALEEMPPGKGWPARWALVEHLVMPSLEAVQKSGATLGLIRPRNYSLTIAKVREASWTQDDLEKMRGESKVDLFGNILTPKTLLEKLPVQMRYVFDCQDDESRHNLIFEDWEIGASWRVWKRKYRDPAVLEAAINYKYVEEPQRKSNMFFFVGNVAAHPQNWMVIGQVRPEHLAVKTAKFKAAFKYPP